LLLFYQKKSPKIFCCARGQQKLSRTPGLLLNIEVDIDNARCGKPETRHPSVKMQEHGKETNLRLLHEILALKRAIFIILQAKLLSTVNPRT